MHLSTFRKTIAILHPQLLCHSIKYPRFTDGRHCVLTATTLSTPISAISVQYIVASRLRQCTSLVVVLSILDVTRALHVETVAQEKIDPDAIHGPRTLTHIGEWHGISRPVLVKA
jgi:hypothetical protein